MASVWSQGPPWTGGADGSCRGAAPSLFPGAGGAGGGAGKLAYLAVRVTIQLRLGHGRETQSQGAAVASWQHKGVGCCWVQKPRGRIMGRKL